MKKLIKNKRIGVIVFDVLLAGHLVAFRYLSEFMLTWGLDCQWEQMGGQCITCGGTHFVRDLLSGRIITAFCDNEYLFLLTIFFVVSFVLLNLYCLFDIKVCKKILSKMYCVPTLVIWVAGGLLFFVVRNIPLFIKVWQMIFN